MQLVTSNEGRLSCINLLCSLCQRGAPCLGCEMRQLLLWRLCADTWAISAVSNSLQQAAPSQSIRTGVSRNNQGAWPAGSPEHAVPPAALAH